MSNEKESWVLEPLTDDEIRELAERVIRNEVYLPPDGEALDMSFGALLAMSLSGRSEDEVKQIGTVWEEMGHAGSRSVNGYPMFLSCHFVHRDSVKPLIEKIVAMQAALKAVSP